MQKAFVLCPALLVALMPITFRGCERRYPTEQLIVTRDIAAGEVIQENDLQDYHGIVRQHHPETFGWAGVTDRPKVIGHKARSLIGIGSHFRMSEIEP